MTPYDVIVLGLGGMGSSAAYHLASRGQRVLGLERHGPAHDLGSSHGGSRIIRQSYFEDPAYVPLLQRAYDLWDKLKQDSGLDVVTVTGGIYLGGRDSTTFAGSLRAAQEWSLPHEVLEPAEIRRRFPTLDPDPSVLGLYEDLGGFARPELTVTAHLDLAARAGADLHFTEPALSWTADPAGDGVEVVTGAGRHRASRLVIAPGSWAPQVLADLGLPLVVERQVMYWFDPAGGVAPYLPDRHPVYIWEAADTTQVYGFPAIDGPDGGAKIAFFRRGTPCTPDTIDRTVHDHEVETMRDYTRPRLPSLPGPLLHAATCMYTTTPDEHFVIARHPRHAQVTVACGFSGHGFKFVPVVGEILADLATTGGTEHPVALFDPERTFR